MCSKLLTIVADQTGCAIVLIGHLNKAVGANSAYRGLGSMDFRAAARSVLLVGRMKKTNRSRHCPQQILSCSGGKVGGV